MRWTRTALGCSCPASGVAIAAFCSKAFLVARSDAACALVLLAGGATCASCGCSSFSECTILRLKCINARDKSLYAAKCNPRYISCVNVCLVVGCLAILRIRAVLAKSELLVEVFAQYT